MEKIQKQASELFAFACRGTGNVGSEGGGWGTIPVPARSFGAFIGVVWWIFHFCRWIYLNIFRE